MDPNAAVLKGLDAADLASGKLPPVEAWNPAQCGDIDMIIRADGVWMYNGTPIGRARLVRLFSTILKREGEDYYLVTPIEKARITVEDAPFLAVAMAREGEGRTQTLTFTTNVGDEARADGDHAIRVAFDPETDEPAPYIHIRRGLEAKIARPVFYDLVALGVEETQGGDDQFGVWSAGVFFPFAPAARVKGV